MCVGGGGGGRRGGGEGQEALRPDVARPGAIPVVDFCLCSKI